MDFTENRMKLIALSPTEIDFILKSSNIFGADNRLKHPPHTLRMEEGAHKLGCDYYGLIFKFETENCVRVAHQTDLIRYVSSAMCQCEDFTSCEKPFYTNRVDFLYDNELDSDVVFLVGIEPEVWRIPGHRKILSEASPVFRALLEGPLATDETTIVIEDVESRAFDYLLRYIYGKEVSFQSPSTALTTLYAAHKYLCPGLIELCVRYLDENLNLKNVLEIFTHARLYAAKNKINDFEPSAPAVTIDTNDLLTPTHCYPPCTFSNNSMTKSHFSENNNSSSTDFQKESSRRPQSDSISYWPEILVENCLRYIDENASEILKQESIEDMSAEDLREIVKRDTLKVKTEYAVFLALDRWGNRECKRRKLNLNQANRRLVLEDLIYEIRFPFLTSDEFISGPLQTGLLTQQEMVTFSCLISKSKCDSSVPQKWKTHMEKVCRKRIYNESESDSSSQKTNLVESKKNKELMKNFSVFKKITSKKSKITKEPYAKSLHKSTDEREGCCSKCFPECLIDLLVCLFD